MSTSPKHRAKRNAATTVTGMLSASAAVGAGTIAAVLLSGGTYALWSDDAQVNASTVESGTFGISATETFNDALFSNLLVGESVRQSFTVTNTGTTSAALTGAATASSAFEVRLASGACATAIGGASATVTPASLGTLAGGATATYCLEVTASASAQPGNSAAVLATISAGQN